MAAVAIVKTMFKRRLGVTIAIENARLKLHRLAVVSRDATQAVNLSRYNLASPPTPALPPRLFSIPCALAVICSHGRPSVLPDSPPSAPV